MEPKVTAVMTELVQSWELEGQDLLIPSSFFFFFILSSPYLLYHPLLYSHSLVLPFIIYLLFHVRVSFRERITCLEVELKVDPTLQSQDTSWVTPLNTLHPPQSL